MIDYRNRILRDPLKPPGNWRLLFQVLDTDDKDKARAALVRIFGPRKGNAAVLVRGCRRYSGSGHYQQTIRTDLNHGFRAYLRC